MFPVKTKGLPIYKIFETAMHKYARGMFRRYILEAAVLKDLDGKNIMSKSSVTRNHNNRLLVCTLRYEGNKGAPSGLSLVEVIAQGQFEKWFEKLQATLPVEFGEVDENRYDGEGPADTEAAIERVSEAYIEG